MDYNYPLLHKVFSHFENKPHEVGDIYLVCCQHLLEPQLKMFELFIEFGFDPKRIIVLGKAYSTNKDVFSELEAKGIKVFQPEFTGKAFDEEHKNNCEMLLELISEDAKLIILDDGAELIKVFADKNRDVLFAVEQTSSGYRKLENEQLSFPLINVARSSTKLVQESPLVARLCFERIKDHLINKKVNSPVILVVGLGPIGESIFEIFKQNKFTVHGFDIKHGHTDLLKTIVELKPNVIVGATGVAILERNDIDTLVSNEQILLISVSSSDREFPVASFRKGNEIHADITYKNITFVNNGFPITFKGNRYESTPIEIEKTICLLGGSVISGIVNDIKGRGFTNVPEEVERLIN